MTSRIYIKLQSPSIELPVQAKDAAGIKDTILVGFKRYGIEEARPKSEKFQEIQAQAYILAKQELAKQSKFYNLESIDENLPEATMTEDEIKLSVDSFIKDEVLYIKQVQLTLEDDKGTKDIKVSDTRTCKPNEPLWASPEDCLSVLIDLFLDCAPYRGSLIAAQQKALANVDYKDAEIKN